MLQSSFTVWVAGNLVGWQAGLQIVSQSQKRGVWRKDKLSLSCGVFFLLDCALRQACKNPCWVMHSLCVCLSHHLELSLIHPTCTTSSVTFSLFLSPLVTLWLLSLLLLSVSLSLWVFQGCLSVFSSVVHYFSWSLTAFLADCESVFISLSLYVSGCICLSASSSPSLPLFVSNIAFENKCAQVSSYQWWHF